MAREGKKKPGESAPPGDGVGGRGDTDFLTPPEEAVVVCAILEGVKSVDEVNLRLASRGYKPISRNSFYRHYNKPEIKSALEERRQIMIVEAQGRYLDGISTAGRLVSATGKKLLPTDSDDELNISDFNHKAVATTFGIFKSSLAILKEAITPKYGGAQAVLEAEKAAQDAVAESDLDETAQIEVNLAVREAVNDILRDMVARKNAQKASEPQVEE